MKKHKQDTKLITIPHTAEILNVNDRTARRYIDDGSLDHQVINSRLKLVDKQSVDRLAAQRIRELIEEAMQLVENFEEHGLQKEVRAQLRTQDEIDKKKFFSGLKDRIESLDAYFENNEHIFK